MNNWLKNRRRNNLLHNLLLIIRWPLGCLIIFGTNCTPASTGPLPVAHKDSSQQHYQVSEAFKKIKQAKRFIRDGDLVTRTGNDFTSQSLRSLNRRDKTYSHCGIASLENDSLFIYHALGGEWNPDQKIRRDLFEMYSEPYSNNGIGIFRFTDTAISGEKIVTAARRYYDLGIMFDMDFNLASSDRMYCAEYISRSLAIASGDKILIPSSFIGSFEFIGVDDIFLYPTCKKLVTASYK